MGKKSKIVPKLRFLDPKYDFFGFAKSIIRSKDGKKIFFSTNLNFEIQPNQKNPFLSPILTFWWENMFMIQRKFSQIFFRIGQNFDELEHFFGGVVKFRQI